MVYSSWRRENRSHETPTNILATPDHLTTDPPHPARCAHRLQHARHERHSRRHPTRARSPARRLAGQQHQRRQCRRHLPDHRQQQLQRLIERFRRFQRFPWIQRVHGDHDPQGAGVLLPSESHLDRLPRRRHRHRLQVRHRDRAPGLRPPAGQDHHGGPQEAALDELLPSGLGSTRAAACRGSWRTTTSSASTRAASASPPPSPAGPPTTFRRLWPGGPRPPPS